MDDFELILEAIARGEISSDDLAALNPTNFGAEQGALDQQMALAGAIRQRGPERTSPGGALLGGLSNAVGNAGGAFMQAKGLDDRRALGQSQVDNQNAKTKLWADLLRNKAQPRASREMLPTMGDDELADLFVSGG